MKRPSKNDETSLGVYSLKVKGGRHGLMEVVDEDPFFNHSFILVFDTLIENESDAVQALHHAAQPVYAGPIYTRDLVDRRIRKLATGRPSLHYRPFAYTGPVDSERDVRDFSGSLYRPLSSEETVPPPEARVVLGRDFCRGIRNCERASECEAMALPLESHEG